MVVSIAAAVAAAYGVSQLITPRYEATATLFVGPSAGTSDANVDVQYASLAQSLVTSYARLAQTRAVVDAAARRAGLGADKVASHFDTEVEDGVQILKITADAPSGQRAALIANAVAAALSERVAGLSGPKSGHIGLQQVDRAAPSADPASPVLGLNLVVGGIAGLLIGVALGAALERLDQRIRTGAEAEDALGLPVLGVIPKLERTARRRDALTRHGDPRLAEPFRNLAIGLASSADRRGQRTILLTSARPQDGKTTVAAHLALSLAEQGRRTALIEADLRRPSLRGQFPSKKALSVGEALRGLDGSLPDTTQVIPDLNVLAAGAAEDAGRMLRGTGFERLLQTAQRSSNFVLLDGPPALPTSDASVLAQHADTVLLVVRSGESRADECRDALVVFKRLGVDVAGLVLTRHRSRRPGYYGGRSPTVFAAEHELKRVGAGGG